MRSTTFRVVLDANALFPNTLRDTLLRAASAGLYQVQWSARILEEARRNLVLKGLMSEDRSKRLVEHMQRAFPEALVTGYEELIPSMRNNEGDRHVTAVAVLAGAEVIVTSNLKHFRREDLPSRVVAKSPDEFLLDLLDLAPEEMLQLLRAQAVDLKNPPVTLAKLLGGLAKSAPRFVGLCASALKVRTDAEVERLVDRFEQLLDQLEQGEVGESFWTEFSQVVDALFEEFPEMERSIRAAAQARAHRWVRVVYALARQEGDVRVRADARQMLHERGFDLDTMDIGAMSDEELRAMMDKFMGEKH
jgi:predicted nucleic acid-binding protein